MAGRSFNEEGMSPLDLGRTRYQQKDWSGAVEAFSEAIKMNTGILQLAALDSRAATYEKTGELQAALRDSKRMIDYRPELAKGYLRCAKVLQLKGEKDLALKIYERGLKKVKVGTDNDRTTLQSMYNKLRQAQGSGESLDPLKYLPLELAQMVIENLEMRDRVICLAVSRPWKRLLESSHKLWTTFDTSSARKSVSKKSLKAHLRRSHYTLNSAIISMRAQFDTDKLTYLTNTCKHLKRLEIKGSGVIGDSLTVALPLAQNLSSITVSVGVEIGPSAIQSCLESCKKTLVEAKFLHIRLSRPWVSAGLWPRLESLRTLELRAFDGPSQTIELADLLDSIPSIKSLSLVGWKFPDHGRGLHFHDCKYLEHLDLRNGTLQYLPAFPPTLKSLNLSNNHTLHRYRLNEIPELPMIESFACSSTPIPWAVLNALLSACVKGGHLKRLDISRTDPDTYLSGSEECLASPTVEELSLAGLVSSGGSMAAESHIIALANCYPHIKKLDVSSTKVTGVAVKHFVSMGVKWLTLNECQYVGIDAVEYARGKESRLISNFLAVVG